jgi:hypothetical protein
MTLPDDGETMRATATRMTMARRRLVVAGTACALLATPLANCAGNGHARSDERANVYPENYRSELLGFLHTYINDPTQIRDAAIAEPVLRLVSDTPDRGNSPLDKISRSFERSSGPQERYIVCVRYNAKDRDGRYTGLKQGMVVYTGGRFDRLYEQRQGPCEQANYKPFPELEALSR